MKHGGDCGTNIVEIRNSKRSSSASMQRLMRERAISRMENPTIAIEMGSSSTLNAADYHQYII